MNDLRNIESSCMRSLIPANILFYRCVLFTKNQQTANLENVMLDFW